MLWESLIKDNKADFITGIKNIAIFQGIKPEWLMHPIYIESKFNPKAVNPITGATGLIQFMPDTAIQYGVTTSTLYNLSNVAQLNFVYNYLLPFKGKLKTWSDVYFAIFFPIAIGKPDNWVLQHKTLSPQTIAIANPAYDPQKKGYVTVGDVKAALFAKIPLQYRYLFLDNKKKILIVAGIIVLISIFVFIFRKKLIK